MEFTISKPNLLRGLQRTHAVADRKSSMPILSNVLLSADGPSSLGLSATDLYLSVQAEAKADVQKGGSVTVAARTLYDIVKNLPDSDIKWKVGDNFASQIHCGKVSYKIPGMSGEDFPSLPSPGNTKFAEIDIEALAELIALTQYSMSHDDTRPHLAGTLFEGDGDLLRMVTTDGHRLSKAERRLDAKQGKLKFSMLIPAKGVAELKRLIEDSKAARSKEDGPQTVGVADIASNAFFRKDGVQLSVKLADEQFPPYGKVIPQSQQRSLVIGRQALVEALRRISLVASDKSGGVRLHIEAGTLRITSENPDVGEGSEELSMDYAGDSLVVGFNAKYMLDALTALHEDEVKLGLGGELDPGVIEPVGDTQFIGVVMPMRI